MLEDRSRLLLCLDLIHKRIKLSVIIAVLRAHTRDSATCSIYLYIVFVQVDNDATSQERIVWLQSRHVFQTTA